MTYVQELDVQTNSKIIIKLFKNVKNIPEIRQKIIKGSLQCCVVKPSLIIDPFQLTVAANKAVCAEKLKTKSIYNEILFNLSVSKNISQSLQTFGIDDKESNILVAVIIKGDNQKDHDDQEHHDDQDHDDQGHDDQDHDNQEDHDHKDHDAPKVFEEIQGDEVELDELKNLSDEEMICKVYKIGDVERKNIELIDSIVSRIAVKDCLL